MIYYVPTYFAMIMCIAGAVYSIVVLARLKKHRKK